MDVNKEIGLENIANKIGIALLLSKLFYSPILSFIEKNLNFEVIEPTTITMILILLIPSLLLLKVNFKEIFVHKSKMYKLGFKASLLLILFFVSFNKVIGISYFYGTGYYKLLNTFTQESSYSINTFYILIAWFIAVISEEIIFRGIFLEKVRKYGNLFAIVVSGVIFGSLHYELIVPRTIAGISLGILYVLGGSIKLPIILHFINNMLSGLDSLILKFYPQLTEIQINISILIGFFFIMLISLLFCLKDETLKPLFHQYSIKNILKKLKQDKSKYKLFLNSPAIVINLIIDFFIIFSLLSGRLSA